MPKHKNKQRRNNWNSGSQRNNWQNPHNSYQSDQSSVGQNYYNDTYFEPSFQHNVAQSYSNNFFDPRFQNNIAQNYNNSYFNPDNSHGNFSQNFPRNFPQNGQQTMRQTNKNNNVQGNTIKNFRSNNFNERNANSGDYNRNFQGNIQHSTDNDINVQIDTDSDIETDLADDEINVTGNSIQQNIKKNIQQKLGKSESQYKILNGHKLSKEVKLKARIDNYAITTQLYNEKGYIIKESLYKNPCLFQEYSDSNDDQTNSNEANNEWTDTFWKKHNVGSVLDNSRTCQNIGKVSKKNQNRLEKSLDKMLAKPAEMSKGMSLLQKMGWTGGGLGKDGDGIVEPIAPKATYAVKTIGLGHLTEKVKKASPPWRPLEKTKKSKPFSHVSKHQLKSPEFQNNFCMNLLLYILQFVKNDTQNKIVFEPRLSKMERKRIHNFVEKIRECSDFNEFDDIKHLSDKHFALIKDIWAHNCYELWTESEGEGQERRLCLYKEAPAHVYLVTPEDLTQGDENETNDGSDEYYVQDTKKIHCIDVKDEVQSKNKQNIKDAAEKNCISPKTKTENDENINLGDKIENKIGINEQKLENECESEENCSIIEQNRSRCDTNINLCDEIERKMEINDQTTETNDRNSVLDKIELETQKDIINKTEQTLRNGKNTNALGKIKEENDENVNFVEQIDSNEKAIAKIKSENDKKMDGNEKSVKNDSILGKIVKYFKEFLEDAVFKEFRFLGPFSDEELTNIDLFFDICMEVDNGDGEEKGELLKFFDDELLEVLEDNNGKRFIHKKEENQGPPQSEEDSSDNVICLD